MSDLTVYAIAAYEALGVKPEDVRALPSVTNQLRQLASALRKNGRKIPSSPFYYLRASDQPEARMILEAYESVTKTAASMLPFEAFCCAAGVSPWRALEIVVGTCARLSSQAEAMVTAAHRVGIVEKTIEMAYTDEGVKDRAMFHKATGWLPSPRGPQTNIHVSASASASSQHAVVSAPVPEQTIRKLTDRFNAARVLSAPDPPALEAAPPSAPARVYRTTAPVEVLPEDDEED